MRGEDLESVYVREVLPVKQRYYLDYVEQHDMAGDLRIIARTLLAVLGGRRSQSSTREED
jgi:lipopolysaccharide/colanic/teichoic acid biosynthesis glycosyltransferase